MTSKADSHFIIGQHGAELLSGNGDMLLITADSAKPQHISATVIYIMPLITAKNGGMSAILIPEKQLYRTPVI